MKYAMSTCYTNKDFEYQHIMLWEKPDMNIILDTVLWKAEGK